MKLKSKPVKVEQPPQQLQCFDPAAVTAASQQLMPLPHMSNHAVVMPRSPPPQQQQLLHPAVSCNSWQLGGGATSSLPTPTSSQHQFLTNSRSLTAAVTTPATIMAPALLKTPTAAAPSHQQQPAGTIPLQMPVGSNKYDNKSTIILSGTLNRHSAKKAISSHQRVEIQFKGE